MFQRSDFKKNAPAIINWIAWYFENLETFPVKSQLQPKEIYHKIPTTAPEIGADLEDILKDLTEHIVPGITHWQHPNFHAYFTANSSVESVYAEFITAAIGAQCMIWETSPAAAELEERMMEWLQQLMGIPADWEGTIQDTASTASLAAILTAREVKTNFESNETGVPNNMRVYCSTQTHSSIEKGVGIAGMGRRNCVKIGVDEQFAMRPDLLEQQIKTDIEAGKIPTCVVVAIGTTGTVAVDDLDAIGRICERYDVWLHVDAAFAGSALLLPDYHYLIKGIERADSFVFNPHKWLFTNFDCSVYFVKNVDVLLKTFEILPEYLVTKTRGLVNDYRDWGIPLGRRFRALKLWFVLRGMGVQNIQNKLQKHIDLNTYFAEWIQNQEDFELVLEPFLNFTCFRLKPQAMTDENELNQLNTTFLSTLNTQGNVFLSHTKVHGKYVLRMIIGQTYIEQKHVDLAIAELQSVAKAVRK